MRHIGSTLHWLWFGKVRGYPIWGWLALAVIIVGSVYVLVIEGSDSPACNDQGYCLDDTRP